jgi:uncharacterized protein
MSLELAEKIHCSLYDLPERNIKIIWHGGEPLLRGIKFYKSVVEIQKKLLCQIPNLKIENSVMTNGTLLTDEWVRFFVKNKWRLGISLDGQKPIHDKFRVNKQGGGSFEKALAGRKLAENLGMSVGMIAVITSETVKYNTQEVYDFLTSVAQSFDISPCWEASSDGMRPEYVVEPNSFVVFAAEFFDIWWRTDNPKVNIKLLKNLLHGVLGGRPQNCAFSGNCKQFICVDSDGNVYPCGKFAGIEKFCLGSILDKPLHEIISSQKYVSYLNIASEIPEKCQSCKWVHACNNGCTYDRYKSNGEFETVTPFCDSWTSLFNHIENRVNETLST